MRRWIFGLCGILGALGVAHEWYLGATRSPILYIGLAASLIALTTSITKLKKTPGL